MFALTLVIFV